MKQKILNNLKNIKGWKTNRKLVVISVDDYGNVRLNSKDAFKKMNKTGVIANARFDHCDALETREDLEALYDVLSSIKDKNDRHAVFTPFAIPCNINFEAMKENGYQKYIYELLPETFGKLEQQLPNDYAGTWSLWKEGIDKGLMKPQFHGREHFNLEVFNEKLKENDTSLLLSLENNSNVSLKNTNKINLKYTAAFGYENIEDLSKLIDIAIDGLIQFDKVFGYRSSHFMAPTANVHSNVITELASHGIKAFDRGIIFKEYQGNGKFISKFNYTGKKNKIGQIAIVRNVVFEPFSEDKYHVQKSLQQIEAAFFWKRPAIISSHRVNYCGHIDEKNRTIGLNQLKILLTQIVKRWPDVEFISSSELINLMSNE